MAYVLVADSGLRTFPSHNVKRLQITGSDKENKVESDNCYNGSQRNLRGFTVSWKVASSKVSVTMLDMSIRIQVSTEERPTQTIFV